MHQLSGLDLAFLGMEQPARPMHLGALLVFDSPRPVDPKRLARLLAERAAATPTLTKTVRGTWWPPGGAELADAESFNPADHVYTHQLPEPGAWDQLSPLVATVMAEPLPEGRPPWELHVINGLGNDHHRFAVLAKLHHALTDGAGVPLVAGPLLDGLADLGTAPHAPATNDGARGLGQLTGLAKSVTAEVRRGMRAAGIASATLATARPALPALPALGTVGGTQRCWTPVRLDTEALHRVRKRHGGTLNDVVLSIIAGGLRSWPAENGQRPSRAFIPVDLRKRTRPTTPLGNHLSGYLCELPTAEPDPLARLRAVRRAIGCGKAAGPARGPGAFPLVAQALPALAHRVVTPLLASATPLLFDTMITTVALPDLALRLDGADLREVHPIAPLAPGHALSIALTTYRGGVHIGLLSDPDLAPSADKLGGAITDAAERLHHATSRED